MRTCKQIRYVGGGSIEENSIYAFCTGGHTHYRVPRQNMAQKALELPGVPGKVIITLGASQHVLCDLEFLHEGCILLRSATRKAAEVEAARTVLLYVGCHPQARPSHVLEVSFCGSVESPIYTLRVGRHTIL